MEVLLPAEALDGTSPLLALDVDGVLNQFNDGVGPERRLVRTAHGAKYWIDFDPAIIVELDRIIRDHGIEIGWLTTWGPNVRALIEQAFDGLLSGGFVLGKMPPRYRGAVPANWKFDALRRRVLATGQPWVWADDEAIDMAKFMAGDALAQLQGTPSSLLIPTAPETGITWVELETLDSFARGAR